MNLTEKQQKELLMKKNVVSIKTGHKIRAGVDTGADAIVVGVSKKEALSALSKADIIPAILKTLNGLIPTDVQVVRKIYALDIKATVDRTKRIRPAPGGVSVGHPNISAGTLGIWVPRNSIWGILSNNHVLGDVNQAKIGDLIYQPGVYDGGTLDDAIARLAVLPLIDLIELSNCPVAGTVVKSLNFAAWLLRRETRILAPVRMDVGLNLVDCAWAEALDESFVEPAVLDIGLPQGEYEFKVGDEAQKSCRSAGHKLSLVSAIDAAINVNMGDNRIGMFTDQLEFDTPGFIIPGSSGCAIFSMDARVGGLAFAGNEDRSYANKYVNVKRACGLDTIEG